LELIASHGYNGWIRETLVFVLHIPKVVGTVCLTVSSEEDDGLANPNGSISIFSHGGLDSVTSRLDKETKTLKKKITSL
jgi:hypothetical protein